MVHAMSNTNNTYIYQDIWRIFTRAGKDRQTNSQTNRQTNWMHKHFSTLLESVKNGEHWNKNCLKLVRKSSLTPFSEEEKSKSLFKRGKEKPLFDNLFDQKSYLATSWEYNFKKIFWEYLRKQWIQIYLRASSIECHSFGKNKHHF